jgi:hypothetical protein
MNTLFLDAIWGGYSLPYFGTKSLANIENLKLNTKKDRNACFIDAGPI